MVDFEWFVVLLIQYFVDEAFSDPIRYAPVPKPEAETINSKALPSSSPSKKLCNFELISFHCKKCDKQKRGYGSNIKKRKRKRSAILNVIGIYRYCKSIVHEQRPKKGEI